MDERRFNIRVYGLLIDEGKILVTDEFRLGIYMTKFPGGGLKYGEGTIDCLKREFMEELHTEVNILSHYYTTDFFVASTLLPFESQVINVYYLADCGKPFSFKTTDKKFDFPEIADGAQCFRWMEIRELKEEDFTFPIDKKMVTRLIKDFEKSN
ncbi:MAG: NUDIX domain-containing protein [Bacteroidetes bacterium]|nr:NUDIX domain-containing protein [Bacteroidota bacterium]